MKVPAWLTFLIAGLVIAFGIYRLRLSRRDDEEQHKAERRGGLYAMSRRRHLLFGALYLLLGAYLIALGLGFNVLPLQQGDEGDSTIKSDGPARPHTPGAVDVDVTPSEPAAQPPAADETAP